MAGVVDDFEDGDIQGWGGATSAFEADDQTVLSGSFSGKLSTGGSGGGNSVTSPSLQDTDDIWIELQIGTDVGNSSDHTDIRIRDSTGTQFGELRFEDSTNDIIWTPSSTTVASNAWSAGTTLVIRLIPDYANDQLDVEVDGTVESTGLAFSSSVSECDAYQILTEANNSSTQRSVWVDDLRYQSTTVPTVTVDATRDSEIDLSWDQLDFDEYAVYRAEASGSTVGDYTEVGTPSTNSFTDTGLENGEKFFYRVAAREQAVEYDLSSEVSGTTTIPQTDFDTVALPVDLTNTTDVSLEWTKQDDSPDGEWEVFRSTDGSLGTKIEDGLAVGTTSITDTDTNREDTLHYTLRRVTDHATQDSTQIEVDVVTPPSGFQTTQVNQQTIETGWTDETGVETAYRVFRSTDGGSTFTQDGSDLAVDTESYETTSLTTGTTYTLKARVVGDNSIADSGTVDQRLPDVSTDAYDPSGWRVEVDHPDGRTVTPTVVGSPSRNPTVNGYPTLEIPVPRDEAWQDSTWEDATIRVWKDGQRQPVEELEAVAVTPGETILTARGGVELRTRVEDRYEFADAHSAVETLIQDHTSYTANVDTPSTTTYDDQLLQDADSDTEWSQNLQSIADTDPLAVQNGNLELLQSCFFREGEDTDSGTTGTTVTDSDTSFSFSAGEAQELTDSSLNPQWNITTDYKIPASDVRFEILVRVPSSSTNTVDLDLNVDGETIGSIADVGDGTEQWVGGSVLSSDLSAGSHTLEVDVTSNEDTLYLDAVALVDDRETYTFDVAVDSDGFLAGPELFPVSAQLQTVDALSGLKVVGGKLTSTWNDTSENQAVAISNDEGSTWQTASNSSSVDSSFASGSPQIRARFTLSRWGTRSTASPTSGYKGQTVDLYDLHADLDDIPTLVDRTFDDRLMSILQTIAEEKDFIFEIRHDGSGFSVEWAQPGQRTSNLETDVTNYSVTKQTSGIVEKAVVYGSSQRIRGETFTSNHGTFVDLTQDRLLLGSEAVYDPSDGTQFDRNEDYQLDANNGQIKVLADGDMADSTDFDIDYNYKTRGTWTASGVSSPIEDRFDISALATDRSCEQAAYYIVDQADDAIYEAEARIPKQPAGWSVIDEIDPAAIPSPNERLQIREITDSESEVVLRLASRASVSEIVSTLQARVSAVSQRV